MYLNPSFPYYLSGSEKNPKYLNQYLGSLFTLV